MRWAQLIYLNDDWDRLDSAFLEDSFKKLTQNSLCRRVHMFHLFFFFLHLRRDPDANLYQTNSCRKLHRTYIIVEIYVCVWSKIEMDWGGIEDLGSWPTSYITQKSFWKSLLSNYHNRTWCERVYCSSKVWLEMRAMQHSADQQGYRMILFMNQILWCTMFTTKRTIYCHEQQQGKHTPQWICSSQVIKYLLIM